MQNEKVFHITVYTTNPPVSVRNKVENPGLESIQHNHISSVFFDFVRSLVLAIRAKESETKKRISERSVLTKKRKYNE